MPSSRRTFLKSTAVASATVALGTIPGSGTILKDEAPLATEPTLDSPVPAATDATKQPDQTKQAVPEIKASPDAAGEPRKDIPPPPFVAADLARLVPLLGPASAA